MSSVLGRLSRRQPQPFPEEVRLALADGIIDATEAFVCLYVHAICVEQPLPYARVLSPLQALGDDYRFAVGEMLGFGAIDLLMDEPYCEVHGPRVTTSAESLFSVVKSKADGTLLRRGPAAWGEATTLANAVVPDEEIPF